MCVKKNVGWSTGNSKSLIQLGGLRLYLSVAVFFLLLVLITVMMMTTEGGVHLPRKQNYDYLLLLH